MPFVEGRETAERPGVDGGVKLVGEGWAVPGSVLERSTAAASSPTQVLHLLARSWPTFTEGHWLSGDGPSWHRGTGGIRRKQPGRLPPRRWRRDNRVSARVRIS